MKTIRMIDVGCMEIGVNEDDFAYLYNEFSDILTRISDTYKTEFYKKHERTSIEISNSLDENKKVDEYLDSGVMNELEHILFCTVKEYDAFVQYAYEYLQDIQSLRIRDAEAEMIGGRASPGYFNRKRKRAIDMKLALKTYTTYIHAYRDTVCKIRFKFKR